MKLTSIENKDKVAIVVVGYNRINSIIRILQSLVQAKYECDAPLVISIDNSGCEPLYDYVRQFEWPYGEKYVMIREKRMGLRDHILSCGDLTQYFKGVIILEDDIYVSEYFYEYALKAVDKYDQDKRIGGISLYRGCMDGNLPIDYIYNGKDMFAIQTVESWGECWTARMWKEFRFWYKDTPEHDFTNINMPVFIKNWKKAWSKFYMAFQIETGKYFVYPSVSLTTCFSEAGVHGITSSIGQVPLLSGPKDFNLPSFDEMTKYDIFGTNSDVYEWIGLSEKELSVDFRGYNDNINKCRYILSPYTYPYEIIKKYALSLRPIELNVKYNVEGDGLYLYDTHNEFSSLEKRKIPLSLAHYYIRQFNVRVLSRYVLSYVINKISAKHKG